MTLPNFNFYRQETPGKEKYIFTLGEKGVHYTIMYLAHKKSFDFHKKDDLVEKTEMEDGYQSFFEMSSFKFLRLLIKLSLFEEILAQELIAKSKINIGKLKKYHCWLVQNDDSNNSENILNVKRKGREIKVNKSLDLKKMGEKIKWLQPDEIYTMDCGMFSLYQYKNGILYFQGFIYKINEIKSLLFLSKKRINFKQKQTLIETYNLLKEISFIHKEKLLPILENIIKHKYKYLM